MLVMPAGIVWGAIYAWYGELVAAAFPLAYPAFAAVSLWAFAVDRRFTAFVRRQVALIVALPFLLHVSLGGFEPSSGVMLWSILGPFAALVFLGTHEGTRWLAGFVGLLIVGMLLQPREANALPRDLVTGFFVLNIGTISSIAYALLATYVRRLSDERARSERLLLNVLPAPIAARLKEKEDVIADMYPAATVLFADVVNSTPLTTELTPAEMVTLLDEHITAFDALADGYGVEKIRTIGDNWMGVAGVPRARDDHAVAAASLALAMLTAVAERRSSGKRCLDFRIGLSSGAVVGGVIGRRKFVFDIWGDAVNTAARMESHGEPGRIQLTRSTYELIRDRFDCEPRGTIEVKGKGAMPTWWLVGAVTPRRRSVPP